MRAATWTKAGMGVVVLLIAVGAGCSNGSKAASDGRAARGSTGPASSGDDYGGPTRAALDAVAGVKVATEGRDCGGGPLDWGWPTTAIFREPSTCLRDTDRVGKPAFMTFSGRTLEDGEYRIVLTVDGHGTLRDTVVNADRTGTVRKVTKQCPVPKQAIRLIPFFPATGVAPYLGDKACDAEFPS